MADKAYFSDIFPAWTMAQQEIVVAAAMTGWPHVPVFRDQLDRHQRRLKSVDSLVDRREMLRPTTRKEPIRIYVASLAVLAWDENDFRQVVETVVARAGEIVSVDDKMIISSDMPLPDAIEDWKAARKRSRTMGIKQNGAKVSAEKKKAIAAAGVEKIRQYWGLSAEEWPTSRLRQMAGTPTTPMAYNTIVEHIGVGRSLARKRHQTALKRAATMAVKNEEREKTIEPVIRVAPTPFNRIVKTVFQGGTLTVEELAQLCNVHISIAERVIASLVARGLVEDVTPWGQE